MAEHEHAGAIYLMGAGRSGTTILAAILAGHEQIAWGGELIHLADWQDPDNRCSCGEPLSRCAFWRSRDIESVIGPAMEAARPYESHRRVVRALLSRRAFSDLYREQQFSLVRTLVSGKNYLLDSSKYIGRAIGLSRVGDIDSKFIYMVRDPRGVVFSFGKRVQTRRRLLSACLYYLAVNSAAQLAAWTVLRGRCIKIRYEDLVTDSPGTLNVIGRFLSLDLQPVSEKVSAGEVFAAEHIAGGNRWAQEGAVSLRPDMQWRRSLGWGSRVLVYLLCLPFQVINRYGF